MNVVVSVVVINGDGNGDVALDVQRDATSTAMECAASLDVMRLRKVITEARYERGGQLLEAVVLTKMF